MSDTPEPLGLIAGSRSLPLLFARAVRKEPGRRLVAVAFKDETDPALAECVDEVVWIRVGQLGRMIEAFVQRNVRRCVMLGQIAPRNLFSIRPDLRALALLLRLKEKNAHSLFGAIADELLKDGVEVVSAVPWLTSHMPGVGFALGPAPTRSQADDAAFGFRIAKEISRLDVGQTVVVKEGTVLAVEAFEGTDACLRRGGALAGDTRGAIAVKVAKHNHDLRFDIPCIGATTVETCVEAGIQVLAFEASRTLVLDRDPIDALARKRSISLLAVDAS